MDEKESPIKRSGTFMLAAQLEGFCIGLRQIVSIGITPGKLSVDLLKKLFKDFTQTTHGKPVENFPEIIDSTPGADLLILAETLRSTMMAFLTPDETEEHNKSFGFGKDRNID
ncbi:MAG: hypothetical protein WC496_02410 [Phycisphaerae bacterium]|jgi:hypothetical protein